MATVEEFLLSRNITFVLHNHPPVYTCEELAQYAVPGLPCKNLLVRDQKKKRYFLVILPASGRTDLKKLGEIAGEKLSFASPGSLMEKLGVEPGAVSPFGLINDGKDEVEVYIARPVYDADVVHFHPNRNTASLELTGEMFRRFLKNVNNKIHVIDLSA